MTQELEPARAAVSGAVELEAELRAGLEGVTPGPWRAVRYFEDDQRRPDRFDGLFVQSLFEGTGTYIIDPVTGGDQNDVEHLARCSPDNIATLINTLATLRSDNERLGLERDEAVERADSIERNGLSNCCREDGTEPCWPFQNLQSELAAAEAERDTLLAQVAKMRSALLIAQAALSDGGIQGVFVDAALRAIDAALTKEPS